MLRDITIGQYYPVGSTIHKLDPRVKLFGLLIFIISLFVFGNIVSYLVATAALIACILLSRVPFKYIVRGLKPIMMLLIFTTILNIFVTPGKVVFKIAALTITKEGIYLSIHVVVRLMYLIIGSSLLTFTTTPTRLTDALEKVLRPLSKIKVPVHEIAMMMSIAVRFIPILVEEADKIMKAQASRGVDFQVKNPVKKVKNMMPVVVPLFISAIRRANELALAMEARCYQGGEGRTKMRVLKYNKTDMVAYVSCVVYLGILIIINLILK